MKTAKVSHKMLFLECESRSQGSVQERRKENSGERQRGMDWIGESAKL